MKKLIASLGLGFVAIAPSQAWSGGDMANGMPNGSPNMNSGGGFGGGHHSFSGGSNYYGGGSHSFGGGGWQGGANGHSGGGWQGSANSHNGGGWQGGANGHSGGGWQGGANGHNGGWSNYSGGHGHQGVGHNFNGGNYNFGSHGYNHGGGHSGTSIYFGQQGFGIQKGRNYIGFGGGSYYQPGISVAVQHGRVGMNYQPNRYVNYGYSQHYVAPRPVVQYRPVYRPIVQRPVVQYRPVMPRPLQYRPIIQHPIIQYRPVVQRPVAQYRPVVQQRPCIPCASAPKPWQRPVINYTKHYSQRTYETSSDYWHRVNSGGGCPSGRCYGGNKIQITWYSRPTYRPYYAPRPVVKPHYVAAQGWQRSARVNSHCYQPRPVQHIVQRPKPVCTLACHG